MPSLHRLYDLLCDLPNTVGYVGAADSGQWRWVAVVYADTNHAQTSDGLEVPIDPRTPWLVANASGDIIESERVFTPLPSGIRTTEVSRADLEAQIKRAFALAPPPRRGHVVNSKLGHEPVMVEADFAGLSSASALQNPEWLDRSPDGFATALCFFSHEAFRYFLPAYMIADLRDQLKQTSVEFHLTFGLTDDSRSSFDYVCERFAKFTREEAQAVVAYLQWKRAREPWDTSFDEALKNYWEARAE